MILEVAGVSIAIPGKKPNSKNRFLLLTGCRDGVAHKYEAKC